ncbi:sulfatase [Halorhabdus sp. CUG00001]|uniref:sulfatase n=1 Tax=Halorhabdus sp. CUG00001 TaxID=2600297 RepID=UPI00131B2CF5|nr:sulfatase [Halorhabdus sp. CUG00001]
MDNIALVTVDSLRADHVGTYGYDRETTPELDALADDALVFENAIAHACATRPSFPSILTSTHGLLYGGFDHLSDEQVPLSVPLSEAGYATAGFHSNPYLSAEFSYDRGFDTFNDSETDPSLAASLRRWVVDNVDGRLYDFLSWLHTKTEVHAGVDVGSYYEDATSLTDRAIAWVEQAEEPWFLWIHYMDPHHPYVPPDEYQVFGDTLSQQRGVKLRQRVLDDPDALSEDEWDDLIDLYDAEVRYTDSEVGRLLDAIGDAVWAVTADHGEEFYEHGNFGHKNRFYDEHVHVPLVLGGIDRSGRSEALVGLNDVPPTLLEAVGVDAPDGYRGTNALDGKRDRVVGGWAPDVGRDLDSVRLMSRTIDEKYIYDAGAESHELYDLAADPEEAVNLGGEGATEHRAATDSFLEDVRETSTDSDSVDIDDNLEEQLQNLGYKT